jgi:Transposase DDE domain/Insertion element 4 transposase N-terminal
MTSTTPFFKPFGPLLFGRRSQSALDSLSRLESLEDLYAIFGDLFAERLLQRSDKGVNSRRRSLPPQVTFWAFVAQALSPKTSCREVVRRIEAWWRWGQLRSASSLTDSAYIQARQRLDLSTLRLIRGQVAWQLERTVLKEERWLEGREVKVVDGTHFSMPDTAANQAVWPQPSGQQPGCGFPVAKMVGLFSLASGALLEECVGDLHSHDSLLFRSLWDRLSKGDIILGDRGFCSYGAMAALFERGVDTVMRLHQLRKVDLRRGKRLGPGDQLVEWSKPAKPPLHVTPAQWELLPQTLAVRLIRVVVETPGFRTRSVLIATTLTDAALYPAAAIRDLYARRWTIELHFAQIKTILQLDVLRCQSPDMIRKELQIHLIAYNLVRALMQKAAHLHDVPLERISFKGSLDALRHWAAAIHASSKTPRKQAELIRCMLQAIAADPLPHRPGRSEPRARKRRPKTYQLLTEPRHQMKVIPHRGKYRASRPKNPLS